MGMAEQHTGIEKQHVTWKEVEDFVREVKTRSESLYTGVYGVPRGGLVLSVMISHALSIPLLHAPTNGCIIVDDICDSGETLLHYANNTSGDKKSDYHIVTMFYKQNKLNIVPEYYANEKKDKWIVFPWEVE